MAVGRGTPTRRPAPAYRGRHTGRGRHAGHGRRRREVGSPAQYVVIGSAVVTLTLAATAVVLPAWGNDATTRLPSPLVARMNVPTLARVPRTRPSAAPELPATSHPAGPQRPTRPPAASHAAPGASPSTSASMSRTARPPVHPPVAPLTYEAEAVSNLLSGNAHIRAVADASGGQVITSIGGAPANALQFNQVLAPFDGVYTLAIHYVSAGDRDAVVCVNHRRLVVLRFPSTNDVETVGLLAIRIRLDSGTNSIEFSNPIAQAPDIDQIIVGS